MGGKDVAALIADYQLIAESGAKRLSDLAALPDAAEAQLALERLIAVGAAILVDHAFVLVRPDDLELEASDQARTHLTEHYRAWLRAGTETGDEVLYGEVGYWQQWWNQLRESEREGAKQLHIDIVLPDDGAFVGRNWLSEFDREIRAHVMTQDLIRSRAIVPPDTFGSPAEPLIELSVESGLEVRVLSTEARFVIYNNRVVVLCDDGGPEQHEAYRATSDRAVLKPLRSYFELLWQSATPWQLWEGEAHQILRLLAEGHTDKVIAAELNVSARTVNRRVAEAMVAYGAASRFELGARYAASTLTKRPG